MTSYETTKVLFRSDRSDPRHGTANGYVNLGCRCFRCRNAWADRALRDRASRAARLAADPTLAPHGRATTYRNWGCRCDECTAAHSEAGRRRRAARKTRS